MIVWIARRRLAGARRLVARRGEGRRPVADAPAPAPEPGARPPAACRCAGRRRAIAIGQGVLLVVVLGRRGATSRTRASGSRSALVGLLALLVLGSRHPRARRQALPDRRARSLGLVLAMALLGPAPAAVARASPSALIDALRRRVARDLPAQQPRSPTRRSRCSAGSRCTALETGATREGGYAVAVFVVFLAANVAQLPDDRRPHAAAARRLAAGDVPHGLHPGAAVGDRLGRDDRDGRLRLRGLRRRRSSACSRSRSASTSCCCARCSRARRTREEIERRTDQLDVRHEGMLGLLLETLALRDPSAARHAAAVAHYAHELARAAGPVRARAGDRPHRRPAARPRQGGAARPHPDRPHASCTRPSGG